MPLSTYLVTEILEWLDGVSFAAAPADVYVALNNGDPGAAGTSGTDVTTTIRTAGRVAIPDLSAVSGRAVLNVGAIDFGVAVGAATVTHFKLYDAASGGNFLGSGAVQITRNVQIGDPVSFLNGDLSITLP